ncbi:hypothetical protein KUTeg_011976 [Tegillarca granosa]|uniref:Agmatinase n=1 Tax=Tegillarca granosa TaxID=220873 RepID=A0ABQ9F0N1_TEGGR|nr:hypothetical protein KUTeg_011976 [Tegillarca granosa]
MNFLIGASAFSSRIFSRKFSTCRVLAKTFNEPLSGNDMPRAGGIASMMRLPIQTNTEACQDIKNHFLKLIQNGCKPLALGGDHTMTYPILQAIKEKYGPVGLVHIDAHADTSDTMLGEKIAHGTPFRRAFEEGCLDGNRGFRVIRADECWHKSLTPLMSEVREMMGDKPVYISFDIDGTPEIGGLTSIQGLEIVRGCKGLNIVGGDLVEVSPPYDTTGTTALVGANLLFEMLCVLPGVKGSTPALGPIVGVVSPFKLMLKI